MIEPTVDGVELFMVYKKTFLLFLFDLLGNWKRYCLKQINFNGNAVTKYYNLINSFIVAKYNKRKLSVITPRSAEDFKKKVSANFEMDDEKSKNAAEQVF
jgi:hypothetical protein